MKEAKLLEEGDVSFFYKSDSPVGKKENRSLYLLLSADSFKSRLLKIDERKIPDKQNNKNWAFVERTGNKKDIKKELPEARVAAGGIYKIVRHENHVHLIYSLQMSADSKRAKNKFNILKEGNFIVSVKNPALPAEEFPERAGQEQGAKFPSWLQEKFDGRRFHVLHPVDFLDYEGAELILIDTQKSIAENLGIELREKPD